MASVTTSECRVCRNKRRDKFPALAICSCNYPCTCQPGDQSVETNSIRIEFVSTFGLDVGLPLQKPDRGEQRDDYPHHRFACDRARGGRRPEIIDVGLSPFSCQCHQDRSDAGCNPVVGRSDEADPHHHFGWQEAPDSALPKQGETDRYSQPCTSCGAGKGGQCGASSRGDLADRLPLNGKGGGQALGAQPVNGYQQ